MFWSPSALCNFLFYPWVFIIHFGLLWLFIDVAIVELWLWLPWCHFLFFTLFSLLLMLFTLLLLRHRHRHCRLLFFLLHFPFFSLFVFCIFFPSLHSSVTRIEKYIRKLLCTRANMEYIDMTFLCSVLRTQQNGKKREKKAIKRTDRRERERIIFYQMSIAILL